jgi:hypothetical protein
MPTAADTDPLSVILNTTTDLPPKKWTGLSCF